MLWLAVIIPVGCRAPESANEPAAPSASEPRSAALVQPQADGAYVLSTFPAGGESTYQVVLAPCVLGDCLFCLERTDDAHEAYVQAQRIDPRDARTSLNLSYTLFQSASYVEALSAITTGLAGDVRGQYRETLLQKQQQILAAISARAVAEEQRTARLPAGS